MEHIELISTGSELLSGRTVNRHAQLLGRRLSSIGYTLARDTTIPDDPDQIRQAISSAWQRVRVVVMSGGLGPTRDDVTRDAVAGLTGRRVVMHEESRAQARKKFEKVGKVFTESAERQVQVVEGAEVLQNSMGIAPGQRIEVDDKILFLLPGPPLEFNTMVDEHVIPWLVQRGSDPARVHERIFMVSGLGESDILARLEENNIPMDQLNAAFCAAPGRVEIRLSAPDVEASVLDEACRRVSDVLGPHIFARERLRLEEAVGLLMIKHNATLATAESCTGGLIGHRVTSVDGSSRYYLGGLVAYTNQVKRDELGVSEADLAEYGAVSEPVAGQMARGVRSRFGATLGVGVTGIAGPTGGSPEKPVGLVFLGVADEHDVRVRKCRFAGPRERIKEWSCQVAMDMLRRRLEGVAL